MLKITALVDNLPSEHHGLTAEHGLSLWIEHDATRILFDFGASRAMLQNAWALQIALHRADMAVCSHAHYDHGNGFAHLLREAGAARLVTGEHFFEKKYAFDGAKYTYLGINFSAQTLCRHRVSHAVCGQQLQLAPGCWAMGQFERSCPAEKASPRFVKQGAQGMQPDCFDDEICLAFDTPRGLVMVVGCSHPGLLNMLQTVSTRLNRPLYAVLGGTHLVEADEARVAMTIAQMKQMGLRMMALSHCSGELAQQMLRDDPEINSCHLGVGESILL